MNQQVLDKKHRGMKSGGILGPSLINLVDFGQKQITLPETMIDPKNIITCDRLIEKGMIQMLLIP